MIGFSDYDHWKTTEPSDPCPGCGRDSLHCMCDELMEDERDDFLDWLNEGEDESGDELPPIDAYEGGGPPPPSDEL